MHTNDEIAAKLRHFAEHIDPWRSEAARLVLRVSESRLRPADPDELVSLEKTASSIYAEISEFDTLVREIAAKSEAAAAQLAPISDALRLVLLEITELGIHLYSVHSGVPHLSDR